MKQEGLEWEYLTTFLTAKLDQSVKEYFQHLSQDWKALPKYAPEAMIPHLNALGAKGWELVHMQPVGIGHNHDVMTLAPGGCSNVYFCVFKRKK